jgi:threonine dehydrogenase-like Zn-dependent dehydrogenase
MGTFVEFSVFKDPATIDWSIIGDRKELDIYGAHLSPYCYPYVIKSILDGSLPTDGVVTHKFPLDDWKKAFDMALTGADNSLKVVLIP